MFLKYCFCVFLFLIVTGCNSIGPKQIYLDRNRYNDIIHQTTDEQLLTNIVRLRYVESTAFLKLSNVTSSYSLNQSTGSGTSAALTYFTGKAGPVNSWNITRDYTLSPTIAYSDTPTITYLPVDDSDFVNELMTPISLQQLHLLFSGGIDEPNTLLRLLVSSVNNIENASRASSAKFNGLPNYKKYYEFLRYLLPIVEGDHADVYPQKINGDYELVVNMDKTIRYSYGANQVRKLLEISPQTPNLIFVDNFADTKNVAHIRLRSVYGVMTYMSYGVQIPKEDKCANFVYVHRNPDGTEFDWRPLTSNLFTVYSSDVEPFNAYVKVYTHNHWFYIRKDDLDSKASFTLLTRLITLMAGKQLGGGGPGPSLTLPVGR